MKKMLTGLPGLISLLLGGAELRSGTQETDQIRSLHFDNAERTFILHLPASQHRKGPMPLLIVLHGGGGTAADIVRITRSRFDALADRQGFIVAYPEALGSTPRAARHWNDGRDVRFSKVDDVGFISALIDDIARTSDIDAHRVYATGYSNGAQMCMRLARDLSEKIASIAPVAYAMPERFASLPVCPRPISVMIITGTRDPLLPWEGGDTPDPAGDRFLGRILSVPASARTIASRDHCSLSPRIIEEPVSNQRDSTRVHKVVYSGGDAGSEVVLYEIERGGHTWPGSLRRPRMNFLGETSRQINACDVIWEFLMAHPMQ